MQEILALRTRNGKHFDMGNGQLRAEITLHDQHYLDPTTGNWEDIDNNWVDEPGFGHKVKKASHNLRINPGWLRFGFTKGSFVDYTLPNKDPIFSGSEMTLADAWPNTDLQYTSYWRGVKSDIILKAPGHPTTFSFELRLSGCTAAIENNELVYRDKDGLTVGKVPAPNMTDILFDSHNPVYGPVQMLYDGRFLTIAPDPIWLGSAAYPITVDPTTIIQPDGTAGKDTCIWLAYPSTNYGTTDLRLGNDGRGDAYSYLQFDLSGIPAGSTINLATLQLYYNYIYNAQSISAGIQAITSAWDEATVTWNAKASYDPTVYDLHALSHLLNSTETWTFTTLVQGWINGTLTNNGLAIINTSTADLVGFASSDNTTAANRPKLTIDYTTGGSTNAVINAPAIGIIATAPAPTIQAVQNTIIQAITIHSQVQVIAPTITAIKEVYL